MKFLELRTFDETPKKSSIIVCFGNYDCNYYYIDNANNAWVYWEGFENHTEYACDLEELQSYGTYEKWAYLENTFDIPFDYDEIHELEISDVWSDIQEDNEKANN